MIFATPDLLVFLLPATIDKSKHIGPLPKRFLAPLERIWSRQHDYRLLSYVAKK